MFFTYALRAHKTASTKVAIKQAKTEFTNIGYY